MNKLSILRVVEEIQTHNHDTGTLEDILETYKLFIITRKGIYESLI